MPRLAKASEIGIGFRVRSTFHAGYPRVANYGQLLKRSQDEGY